MDATQILERLTAGDPRAADELLPIVYDRLRAVAGAFFRDQPEGLTLEPTALVHEAYLKLIRSADVGWESRAHFTAVAAMAMRQILQDRARRRRTEKHGGGHHRVTLTTAGAATPDGGVDIVVLDDVLAKLASLDPRQARIVELRFFGGLNVEEVAVAMDVSKSTVEKEWTRARAWLSCELAEQSG